MKNVKYKVSVSPNGDYNFKPEIYFTYAQSKRQAIFNIVMREPSVRSLLNRDLCEIFSECVETKNRFEEFLDKNWEDIKLYEKEMYVE